MPVLLLYVAVFAGGALTILSPCILPVLPVPLGRAGQPFRSETLPLLADLVAAFVFVAVVGTVGAAWVATAADAGRWLALVLLAAAGASPALPAALFATFGAGAALALGLGVFSSGRVLRSLRRVLGGEADVWARRGLGAAGVAAALMIATGTDARAFASRGIAQTTRAEEAVLRRLVPRRDMAFARALTSTRPPVPTPDEGPLPTFAGGTGWLNTGGHGEPLSAEQLIGKALAAKYHGQDVIVVGIHTPELARERVPENVTQAVQRLGVTYPVVLDPNYSIWRAFHNEYWQSVYIADRNGRIRFHHFGEGSYDDADRVVAQLLAEPAARPVRQARVRM